MYNFFSKLNKALIDRKKAAICTIVDTKGSTPRKNGSKMLVFENGNIEGSVGGGQMEFFIIKKAIDVIKNNKPGLFSFGLDADFKMACGGTVSVFIEPLPHKNNLIIFGAGHIGKLLAKWAVKFNFDITFVDDRKNIFDDILSDEFTILNENYNSAIKKINFSQNSFVCVITHSHSYDKEIAALCGKKNIAFLGVIASKTKARKISKSLSEDYNFSQNQINRINMPMGIPMNCETPEEIAISILAKLIDVKNSL